MEIEEGDDVNHAPAFEKAIDSFPNLECLKSSVDSWYHSLPKASDQDGHSFSINLITEDDL